MPATSQKSTNFALISADLPRTFSGTLAYFSLPLPRSQAKPLFVGLGLLNEEGPFFTQLLEVLEAFALFNPTISYVQLPPHPL